MNELKQVPFLRIAIPLILGIAYYVIFPFYFECLKYIIACCAFCLFIFHGKQISENYGKRWVFGLTAQILVFFIGAWFTGFSFSETGVSASCNIQTTYVATVSDPVSEKDKTIKTFLEFDFCKDRGENKRIHGKALAFFQKDSASIMLEPGDQIVFRGVLATVNNPGNPCEFDYKKYLSYHQVSQQTKIKSGEWKLLAKNKGNVLFNYACKIQQYLLNIFKKSGLSGDEYAVASALIIGYTDKIDVDTKKAYSSTGAMHILSVSGLHVGIVFIVFNFALKFVEKIKHGKIIKAIILILLLWFYASITGLSAAVIRAAAMFSFVVIGKSLSRNVNIINTISSSAVLLLIINPLYLFDIGFQLSYLAVLGIVLFQAKIYRLIYVKNWLLDKIWALMAVSIAAQIATLPITLFHFHQFPNYFLITNVLVIPLSTVVLYLGLAMFSFSFWDGFTLIIGKVLAFTVKALNEIILYIEHLPYSLSENIYISPPEVILFFLLIAFISLFILSKQIKFISLSLVSLIVIAIINIFTTYKTINQKELIAYNLTGNVSLDFIYGSRNILLTDMDIKDRRFQTINNNWIHKGIDTHRIIDLKKKGTIIRDKYLFIKDDFIFFCGKRIGLINVNNAEKTYSSQLNLDYLFLTGSKYFPMKNILNNFNSGQIIFMNLSNTGFDKIVIQKFDFKGKCYSIVKGGSFQRAF